ncbi:rna annealing factor [Ceraceosorus bombacis]|uniref:Rna annealing factor n=1 Tax=Ceraceosorus bombacis TaxID=401625 RepID=A0A0P1BPB8_9BASI|nr:rna annealing factor [Ceraceosorus bombacis]
MNIDKSLDELVAANPKKGGPKGRRGGPRRSGGSAGVHAKAAALGKASLGRAPPTGPANNRNRGPVIIPGRAPGGGPLNSKIIVSNLPVDVTEPQVKELFSTSIGPLRRVQMSFRANGQSTGTVTVEFQRPDDANRAYQQYNNRLIDGKKPIKIEVVVDPAQAAAIAAQQAAVAQSVRGAPSQRGKAATRGRGAARGRGARPKREARPKKTVEDLDAEMDVYVGESSGAQS